MSFGSVSQALEEAGGGEAGWVSNRGWKIRVSVGGTRCPDSGLSSPGHDALLPSVQAVLSKRAEVAKEENS